MTDGGCIVRRLSVTPTSVAVLRAMLASVPCPCGQTARRLTVECDPVTGPRYGSAQDRAERRAPVALRVRTWCGSDSHTGDWEDPSVEPDDCAMTESDM